MAFNSLVENPPGRGTATNALIPPWQNRYALTEWQRLLTQLPPEQEAQFQAWARQNDAPITDDYDMRGFWSHGGQGAEVNQNDHRLHYPDTYKTPLHQSFSGESIYADPRSQPPRWNERGQLVAADGTVLYDEGPQ